MSLEKLVELTQHKGAKDTETRIWVP